MTSVNENVEGLIAPPKPDWTDTPRWVYEEYDGAEQDIASDIFAIIYWRLRIDAEKKAALANQSVNFDTNISQKARLISDSIQKSLEHAETLSGSMDRAFMSLLYIYSKNGLYRNTREEYQSIQEYLIDKIPRVSADSGELSNILYLLHHFFPLLEQIENGWQAKDLLKIKDNWAKMRASIPYLRDLTKTLVNTQKFYDNALEQNSVTISKLKESITKEKDDKAKKQMTIELTRVEHEKEKLQKSRVIEEKKATEKFQKGFDKTLKLLQDASVPAWGPNSIGKLLQAERNKPIIFDGQMTIVQGLSGPEVAFTLVVPEMYSVTVESLMKNLAKFQLTDGKVMVKKLAEDVFKKPENEIDV